jgi:hypothetical protein
VAPTNKSVPRSNLRIADLKQRQPSDSRLMNVKIPLQLWEAIARLARELGANKTETVVALLNAALEESGRLKR